MTALLLLAGLSLAQTPPEAEAAPAEAAPAEAAPTPEPPPPEPWRPPNEAGRHLDGVPIIGPWPDNWIPPEGVGGLDLVDPLTGHVVAVGVPANEGEMQGPELPQHRTRAEPAAPHEPGAESLNSSVDERLGESPSGYGDDGEAEPSANIEPPGVAPAADEQSAHSAPLDGLLPSFSARPREGLGYTLLAVGVGLLSILAVRLQSWLPKRGLLPTLLRFGSGFGRLLTVLLMMMALMVGASGTWLEVVPFVLIGAGIALGWSARDAIRDVLAGAVLLVEAPLDQGDRVRCGDIEGVVIGLGPRAVLLANDRGHSVSVPNRMFLESSVSVDSNPYAPVEVNVHVPSGLSAEQIHQALIELALLSPYLAPSSPPHVYRDPDDANVWIVEARLVSPLYRRDFRGAMVELSEEALGPQGTITARPPE